MSHEERAGTQNHGALTGFFSGLLIGAGLGLLLAPRPGSEVRRTVAASAGDLRRRASETLQQSQERMSHAVERGRDAYSRARHIVDRARHHGAEAGREALHDASEAAESLREGARDVVG
jgi:gas vesicle protein